MKKEIFVHLKLPKNYYEVATGLVRIYDYENFDEYVSDTIKGDVETLLDGAEMLDDCVHNKLTGEDFILYAAN